MTPSPGAQQSAPSRQTFTSLAAGHRRHQPGGSLSVRDPGHRIGDPAQVADSDAEAATDSRWRTAAAESARESYGAQPHPAPTGRHFARNAFDTRRRATRPSFAKRDRRTRWASPITRKPRAGSIYGAEFLRWFADRADGGARGPYTSDPQTEKLRIMVMKEAGRTVFAGHPMELPLGDGDEKDRSGLGGRLHRSGQEHRPIDATDDLAADPASFDEVGLPAGVLNVVPTTNASEVVNQLLRRPPAAQGVVHRIDRCGEESPASVRRSSAANIDGAGWECAVHRVRRRRA